MLIRKHHHLFIVLIIACILAGCDPMAPLPTPQVIIVTPPPSATPRPSPTPPATRTPIPSPTIDASETPTPLPCETDGGTMLTFDDFRSALAGENLRYRVYIPPCYQETQKRYPYVILLHGQAATELQWDSIGADEALDLGVRLGVLGPSILVIPYTGSIANRNPSASDRGYEDVILTELMPAVERDFCTWNNNRYRAIGGISRGGFWSYSIALRHPDIFGTVGGHSAVFDAGNAPSTSNPLDMALNASFIKESNLRMYLDNAASDPAGQGLELFSSRLSSRGIPHTYIIHPVGDHSEDYWSAHVSEYMSFYAKDWPKDISELPSCLEPSP